mgnify:CR=1 FL=1
MQRCDKQRESICTVRLLQETIKATSLRISAYAAARLARTQRFKETRRRGTDRALARSVTASPQMHRE